MADRDLDRPLGPIEFVDELRLTPVVSRFTDGKLPTLDRCMPPPPPPELLLVLLMSLLCLFAAAAGGLAITLVPFLSFDVLAVRRKGLVVCDLGGAVEVAGAPVVLCLLGLGVPLAAADVGVVVTGGEGREERLGAMMDVVDADANADVDVDVDADGDSDIDFDANAAGDDDNVVRWESGGGFLV